jgi:hypothetical protein
MTLLVGLTESSGGQIYSPLLISFHHGSPCSYIIWRINRPIGDHSSEMWSHPINMIIIKVNSDISWDNNKDKPVGL